MLRVLPRLRVFRLHGPVVSLLGAVTVTRLVLYALAFPVCTVVGFSLAAAWHGYALARRGWEVLP